MHESLGQFDRVEDDFWLKQAAIDAAERKIFNQQPDYRLHFVNINYSLLYCKRQ